MHKIKYTDYRQGAIIEAEIDDSTWAKLESHYSETKKLQESVGIDTLEQYVRTVLMMQN